MRILIGGPLIEDVNRTVFEKCGKQGEAFPLSLRQGSGREHTSRDLHLCFEFKLDQITRSASVKIGPLQAEQAIE